MDAQIKFPAESDAFYATVKERVQNYFIATGKSKYGDFRFYFKALLFLSVHLSLYILVFRSESKGLAFWALALMGPLSILIGINSAHDGAHGAVSKRKWVNKFFLRLLDLLGANSYMWKNRHVYSHHLFPNIMNCDADLKQNPMVRIFPDDEIKPHHRFQFLYAPLLYLLYTLNWLLFRDFKDFSLENIGSFRPGRHPKSEIVQLLFFKAIYLSYIICLPAMFSILTLPQVILAYILMNFLASLLITVALVPSHVAETSLFPLPDDKGMMPYSWSHHQVLTVIDFATTNRVLNFFFGGFNHHVTHHLFPHICHTHYPGITPIIRQTALEFGIPYKHEDSLVNAYVSHIYLLKKNGKLNPVSSAK